MADKRTKAETEELRELTQLSDVEIIDLAAEYGVDVADPDTGVALTRDELVTAVAEQKKQPDRKPKVEPE